MVTRRSARGRLSEGWQLARFAWSTLIAPWPPFAVFLAIGGVIAAVAPLLLILATTKLIDGLSANLQLQPEAERSLIESLTPHVPWLLVLIGSRMVSWLVYMDSYQRYLAAQLTERVTERLDRELFRKSLSLRLEWFERTEYYDTVRRQNKWDKRGAFKACNLDANRLRQFSDLPTSVRLDSFASPPVSSPVCRLAVRGTYPPA